TVEGYRLRRRASPASGRPREGAGYIATVPKTRWRVPGKRRPLGEVPPLPAKHQEAHPPRETFRTRERVDIGGGGPAIGRRGSVPVPLPAALPPRSQPWARVEIRFPDHGDLQVGVCGIFAG